ncbi:MAG: RidA family protein [Rhodospirillaceae bacterium]|nr:RidA family protein [Rhodospirillaceae bacterium]MBT5241872.1 RidA family protein [Rhodospirillaceae bacterium]MBT5567021.1 RidA family protein [Rhodospirillaceae bacterium]MBT6089586.1 RidA family protein [Rhodospirillaceae bacterium]MBT6961370.1 RidA family protein [Rhodospirillaceae bacterium]
MVTDAIRIKTDPDPFEAFRIAQGYRVGDLIMMSGQAAIDSAGNLVGAGDFDAQAEQTFQNIQAVLEAAGSDMSRIVKVVIYLTDISNFPKILELREKWFTPPYPADTIVEISSLALPELMIEIDVTALAEGQIINT